ncbi:MAG: HIT family protein [Syntrophobacteraceae bacterium]
MRALTHEDCPFCQNSSRPPLLESRLSFAILDAYPVNPGHLLILPRRHIGSFFELSADEIEDIMSLLLAARDHLTQNYHPDGFNIGINVGDAAGQTIGHVHIHLIPRYSGDVPDPTGGVRGVIPWKSKY